MPNLATRRPRSLRAMASLTLALAFFCLASPDASAQGGLREHYRRFYGQDFYANGLGYFPRLGPNREFRGPAYGPAMMYGRQYGEEYGYATAPAFVLNPPAPWRGRHQD